MARIRIPEAHQRSYDAHHGWTPLTVSGIAPEGESVAVQTKIAVNKVLCCSL